jgi:hypothetical protein
LFISRDHGYCALRIATAASYFGLPKLSDHIKSGLKNGLQAYITKGFMPQSYYFSTLSKPGLNANKKSIAAREKIARFTKHIRFENIDPKELSTTVAASGLVSSEVLHEAYKSQASAALHSPKVVKALPKWKISGDHVTSIKSDILDFAEMKSGKFRWTIRVQKRLERRGFVSPAFSRHARGTPRTILVLALKNKVGLIVRGDFRITTISKKCLELSPGNLNGSLKLSINGGEVFLLFQEINPWLESERTGVLPSARIHDAGEVRLLSLEEVS